MNKRFKKIIYILQSFLFFFMFSINAKALNINGLVMPADSCTGMLGAPNCTDNCPAYYLQMAFNVMKYIAIVALLLLVIMDFFKALVAQDKDAIKKASGTAVKRFIYCIIIFFLPIILNWVLSLFGVYGTCGIS